MAGIEGGFGGVSVAGGFDKGEEFGIGIGGGWEPRAAQFGDGGEIFGVGEEDKFFQAKLGLDSFADVLLGKRASAGGEEVAGSLRIRVGFEQEVMFEKGVGEEAHFVEVERGPLKGLLAGFLGFSVEEIGGGEFEEEEVEAKEGDNSKRKMEECVVHSVLDRLHRRDRAENAE